MLIAISVFSKLLDTTKNFLSNFNISITSKSFSLERIISFVYILYGVLTDSFVLFVLIRYSLHLKRHKLMTLKSLFLTLRVKKIVKQIKFEWVRGGLESRNCFQRQSFTKYLRQTLVFMRNNALREKFNFCFQEIFTSTDKFFFFWSRNDH